MVGTETACCYSKITCVRLCCAGLPLHTSVGWNDVLIEGVCVVMSQRDRDANQGDNGPSAMPEEGATTQQTRRRLLKAATMAPAIYTLPVGAETAAGSCSGQADNAASSCSASVNPNSG